MANKLNESLRKLLDISPKDTSSDTKNNSTGSNDAHIIEINENPVKTRKKFTVVKHKADSKCPTPTESNPNLTASYDKQVSVFTTTSASDDASDLLMKENEDLFMEDVMQSLTTGANNNRYQEGQDTITSLKNSVFVKQLAEMRRRASLKSSKSNQTVMSTSANSLNTDNQSQYSAGGGGGGLQTPTSTKATAKTGQFFRSQESIASKKSSTKHSHQKQQAAKSPSNDSRSKLLLSAQKQRIRSTSDSTSNHIQQSQQNLHEKNFEVNNYQPEQIIETIAEAMNNNTNDHDYHNLIKQIKYILAKGEKSAEKRTRYLKRMFKAMSFLLLFFTFLMSVVVITSVIVQISKIEAHKSNRTYSDVNTTNKLYKLVDNLLP